MEKNTNILHKIYIAILFIYFMMTPLNVVSIPGIGSGLYLLAGVLISAGLFQLSYKIRFSKIVMFQFLFVILSLCSLAYTIDFEGSERFVITESMFLLLLIITSHINYSVKEINSLKIAMIISSILMVLLLIYGGSFIENRFMLRYGNIDEDPNNFNGYLLFGEIAFLSYLFKENKKFTKIMSLVMLIVIFGISILTGSRGGLLCLLAGAVSYLYYIKKEISLYKILGFGFLIIFSFFIISIYDNSVVQRFYYDTLANTTGTGRFEIWKDAFTIFSDFNCMEILFGTGANSFIKLFLINGYVGKVAHNVFINVLLELGVVGLTIYCALIYSTLNMASKIEEKEWALSVAIGFIVLSLSLSIIALKPYWNIIIFVCIQKNIINSKLRRVEGE